ncbi:unnamed protein product [Brassica rapa subsp. trilocularis]|uniref:Uncharacterized protein n=1 Tax=Brassica campestris TaxID=3711 RepID=M4DNF4_BRACM
MVEVAPSTDLRRGLSEVERSRVGFGFMKSFVFPLSDISGRRRRGVEVLSLVTARFVGVSSCRSCVLCLFGDGNGCLGFFRVGEILVPTRRCKEFSGLCLDMEARLKADVIVVKVSCLMPRACASGYTSMVVYGLEKISRCTTSIFELPLSASCLVLFESLATTSLEELSLLFFIVVQSSGSGVDLLALKELVLWFSKAMDA